MRTCDFHESTRVRWLAKVDVCQLEVLDLSLVAEVEKGLAENAVRANKLKADVDQLDADLAQIRRGMAKLSFERD